MGTGKVNYTLGPTSMPQRMKKDLTFYSIPRMNFCDCHQQKLFRFQVPQDNVVFFDEKKYCQQL